jgi:hypothetical protein
MPNSAKPRWIELQRINLQPHHQPTGNTKHYLGSPEGVRQEFPRFVSLSIAQFEGDAGYYLLYHPEQGSGTDTWHLSLDDAMHQAEFEFGVRREEWQQSAGDS